METPAHRAKMGTHQVSLLLLLANAVLALVMLSYFCSSGPYLFDAGELVAAAWQLGASHPPGQTLHAFIGQIASMVPIGPFVWRVAMVSVLGAVFASLFAALLMRDLLALSFWGAESFCRSEAFHDSWHFRKFLWIAAPTLTFWSILLSPVLLRQATRVEVYAPALALVLLSLRLVAFASAFTSAGTTKESRRWFLAGVCGGLAASLHPPHGLAAFVAMMPWVTFPSFSKRRRIHVFIWIAGSLAAFLPFCLYLHLRARAGAPLWGDPSSLSGLFHYLSASAYHQNLVKTPATVADSVASIAIFIATRSSGALLLGLLSILILSFYRWRKKGAIGTEDSQGCEAAFRMLRSGVLATLAVFLQSFDPRNPDNLAYAGPALSCLRIASLWGLCWGMPVLLLGSSLGRKSSGNRPARIMHICSLGIAVLMCLPVPGVGQAFGSAENAIDADPAVLDRLAQESMHQVAPRALVMLQTDFPAASFLMLQAVEGARPDTIPFVDGAEHLVLALEDFSQASGL